MCPLCKEVDGKLCEIKEQPDGRIACACGKHSWPNPGAYLETCRRASLTVTRNVHDWTQSH